MGRILTALAAIALVLLFWHEAASYPATAARLPNILGWLVLILAVLAIAQVLWRWRRERAQGTLVLVPPYDPRAIGIGAAFAVFIVLYAWSIQYVGYLLATPMFLLVPLLVLRPVRLATSLLTTLVVTGAIWGIFIYLLKLPVPLFPGA